MGRPRLFKADTTCETPLNAKHLHNLLNLVGACHDARLSFPTRKTSDFKAAAGNLGCSSCLGHWATEPCKAAISRATAGKTLNIGSGCVILNAGFGFGLIKNLFIPDFITRQTVDLFQKVSDGDQSGQRKQLCSEYGPELVLPLNYFARGSRRQPGGREAGQTTAQPIHESGNHDALAGHQTSITSFGHRFRRHCPEAINSF